MSEDKPMTVGELREALRKLPADVEVFLYQPIDGSFGRSEFLPLDRDLSLSENNKLELYPEFDSVLAYR